MNATTSPARDVIEQRRRPGRSSICSTPAGSSGSNSCARRCATSAVAVAGFVITGMPASSAHASFSHSAPGREVERVDVDRDAAPARPHVLAAHPRGAADLDRLAVGEQLARRRACAPSSA